MKTIKIIVATLLLLLATGIITYFIFAVLNIE